MRNSIAFLLSLPSALHGFSVLPQGGRPLRTLLPASATDYHSLTVGELKELVKNSDGIERGVLSKLKRKQDYIDFLERHHEGEEDAEPSLAEEENDEVDAPTTLVENDDDEDKPTYFSDLGLDEDSIYAMETTQDRWYLPTPIQRLAIPKLLQEEETTKSMWAEAPTGSGKTAAFVLPLLQKLRQEPAQTNGKIRSLILCPTRELAVQIGQVVHDIAEYSGREPLNSMVITGGFRREVQIAQLADWIDMGETVDAVIATPGRLVDVLTRYSGLEGEEAEEVATEAALERRLLQAMDSSNKDSLTLEQIQTLKLDRIDDEGREALGDLLEGLEYLVIDECDRMLSRAFETEMDSVLDLLRPERRPDGDVVQTWLFSATFPKLIEPRVDAVLHRLGQTTTTRISCANSDRLSGEEEISATLQKKMGYAGKGIKTKQLDQVGPASTIKLRTIRMDKRDRTQALKDLWKKHEGDWSQGGVLVFVGTRYSAEHVSRKLRRVGIRSSELHGKLDQDARARRLQDLQTGKTQVLLATDLASRGLDVVGLSAVVNYDLPRSTADFVHRVGRTGRAGRKGTAISFVTPQTESHYDLIERRHIPKDSVIEREILPGLEVDEDQWNVQAQGAKIRTPGAGQSANDLAHDRMFGGIKGKRKSKKDRLRESAAAAAAAAQGR